MTTHDTQWAELVNTQFRILTRQTEQLWEAIAEVRDGLVDLDHAKAPRAQLRELHTRVDLQAEIVAGLEDDLAVLRNDYRGEATA